MLVVNPHMCKLRAGSSFINNINTLMTENDIVPETAKLTARECPVVFL